jgi:endonuclease/exonuclease/phosphatase family metal-dependent hydrolase
MNLFETATCAHLPPVPDALRERIKDAERTSDAHRALFDAMAAMHCLEMGGELNDKGALGEGITVAAWNLQRCLFPEQSADLLRAYEPDIVLVSEMDCGMARTHQRNTARALADSLGMRYLYGLEYYEMGLGNDIERRLAADKHNECGWHGNALLSRVEPSATALIRLDNFGKWFCVDEGPRASQVNKQPRVGGRCAVAAILPGKARDICAVSTHLESNGDGAMRLSQIERLIAAIDQFAPGLPTIIAGDLNTGNGGSDGDEVAEPLFAAAERHGFSWRNNAEGVTTRPSLLKPEMQTQMKLDWFCARDLDAAGAQILPALDERGKPLSDHDVILGHFCQP